MFGYVEVPQSHPLFGKHYADYINDSTIITIDQFFNVHGGITFSGELSEHSTTNKNWWFGFDCYHWSDIADFDLVHKYFPENDILSFAIKEFQIDSNSDYEIDYSVKTLDYVVEQCENLAKQLVDYAKNYEKITNK